ncbi:iron-sulfur cluster carrier protein ApbC [Vibrio ostreicida]|uniref:Iron-sulfur cluster carrier protein n=1 Tax=Vibrio ostreicida TaxID=526588 RepID=A0ABT8BRR8_9VIBR|nr:iron-sulfur cluster carrier protein ApbC [Vibrio ostreicida]MDN3609507.1 iron-sulfur cluster carrier protein ApbC [Vibrio ostreicida]NPD08386.1 iron-sulfur cluster carrier protein ApbC [Vibrio ostreicida]
MRQLTSKKDFCSWLNQFQHPSLISDWASVANIVSVNSKQLSISIPFASQSLASELSNWITVRQGESVASFDFNIEVAPKALQTHLGHEVKGVKNIIAITSAKGGVGKSTTSVNLALALSQSDAKVGLLDADIYGPSVPMMLSQEDAKPEVRDDKWMTPISAYGIYTHSIGYLVSKEEAAIWRGPMASKALAQLLNETEWPDLDYLVIDMPPGTGDIQLTLAQQIPVTGAVIVTTPQDLALSDARKGAAMFEKVQVPVVGLVENMSYHICSHCGEREDLFGSGGAEQMSRDCGLDLLAQIPLHISMRQDIDNGCPTVAARPTSEHAAYYHRLAESVCSRMYWHGIEKPQSIQFKMVE